MKPNRLVVKVTGPYALFTDPMTKIGGEKSTLMIPSYEALRGIMESIYWKPSIEWIIESVKILNPIRTERKGIRPIKYDGGNDLSYYTYLADVSYIITAHFEFNKGRPDLKNDWNSNKHYFIGKRSLERGGRRDVYLGTRECQAYVEPGNKDEPSYYAGMGEMQFGLMYHSFSYPDQNGKEELDALFWYPKMVDGVIQYCTPQQCEKRVFIRKMKAKKFDNSNFTGLLEKDLLTGYQERGDVI
ncbi:type I-C CRISPR-associated protein Cas5c [Anaerostipes sp.]|uniref:type I-C CRISPR-associated protein Cas5c n=1 Tax=Anaerostipes sp. TaxID=1872530 RepID=UPI002584EBDF|nr:type I-C CRISPR-associated protein Cas5c [Anaerostipes sp.]MCI5622626.1 type I-C CRISPR-associated protein Cas5c [Anaerostipes sp.]MDY2725942.1 type I-C CRISPR-associated protein Cas5c [Anaerostipes faecalis]